MKRKGGWLEDLAEAAGDGRSVDWSAAREHAADDAESAVLQQLESISWVRRAFSLLSAREPENATSSVRLSTPQPERDTGPPALIGEYAIGAAVGEGPLGSVYLAERAGAGGRPLALKLIRWRLDSARVLRRFEALREALVPLAESGIVPTVDAGESDESRIYFVHPFVDGLSIVEHCRALGLGLRHRLELFATACELIQRIHGAGLRHGALKPGNVLVERHGGAASPRILDLCVADTLDQRATERALFRDHARPFRDLCYFSPEETATGADPPDARSDIFSLGVLLYELVSGDAPFGPRTVARAEVAEVLRRLREDPPPSPSVRNGVQLPPREAAELDRIVLRALEKERSRRHQSAAELVAEVRHLLKDLPDGRD